MPGQAVANSIPSGLTDLTHSAVTAAAAAASVAHCRELMREAVRDVLREGGSSSAAEDAAASGSGGAALLAAGVQEFLRSEPDAGALVGKHLLQMLGAEAVGVIGGAGGGGDAAEAVAAAAGDAAEATGPCHAEEGQQLY